MIKDNNSQFALFFTNGDLSNIKEVFIKAASWAKQREEKNFEFLYLDKRSVDDTDMNHFEKEFQGRKVRKGDKANGPSVLLLPNEFLEIKNNPKFPMALIVRDVPSPIRSRFSKFGLRDFIFATNAEVYGKDFEERDFIYPDLSVEEKKNIDHFIDKNLVVGGADKDERNNIKNSLKKKEMSLYDIEFYLWKKGLNSGCDIHNFLEKFNNNKK